MACFFFSVKAEAYSECPWVALEQPSQNPKRALQYGEFTPSGVNYEIQEYVPTGDYWVTVGWCPRNITASAPAPEVPPADRPANQCGSIISVDALAISEPIKIKGTGLSLFYSSNRVPGRRGDYSLKVPFANGVSTDGVSKFIVEFEYLGRIDVFQFPQPGQTSMEFLWDGLDQNGQDTQGSAEFTYRLRTVLASGAADYPINIKYILGAWRPKVLGLGGWTISNNHFYDSVRKRLWAGDGTDRSITAKDAIQDANGRTRIVEPAQETPNRYLVTSADLSEAYIFSRQGRHLETRSTKTGALIYSFTYSAQGQLLSIQDSFQNLTQITRPSSSQVRITSPDGLVTQVALDPNGWVQSITEPGGRTHLLTHSSSGLLTNYVMPSGAVKTITYDSRGYLKRDSHSQGSYWDFVLNVYNQGTVRTVNMSSAEGRTTNYDIRTFSGNQQDRTESLPGGSGVRYFSYKPNQSETSIDETGRQVIESYSPDPRFAPMASYTSSFEEKAQTQVRTVLRSKSATPSATDVLRLNSESESVTINTKNWLKNFDGSTLTETWTSPVGRVSKVKYNQFDQVVETQSASFLPVQYIYDTRGRLERIVQGTRESVWTYDSSGYLQTEKNALNQITTHAYDAKGDLIQTTLPDSRIVQFSYDASGNLASVTPSGKQASSLISNLWDILEKYIAPIIGGQTFETSFTYNKDKQLTQITRADQTLVSFAYSPTTGLMSSMTGPEGVYNYTYNFSRQVETQSSPSGAGVRYSYFVDLLTKVLQEGLTDSTASVSYTYDKRRLSSITVNPRLTTQASSSINLTYDDDELLTGVGNLTITREPATGLISTKVLNQVSQTYGYDASYGELSSHVARAPVSGVQTTLFSESITRDALGRIDTKTEFLNNTTTTYRYQYDLAGRLEKVFTNGNLTRTYVYDSNSNRLKRIQGSTTQLATYDAQDRILSLGNKLYTHNDRGELSQTRVNTATGEKRFFTYNSLGAIESVRIETTNSSTGVVTTKLIEYVNDARGLRVLKKINGTINKRYVWDALGRLTAELDSTGKITTHYVYAGDSHVPEYMIQGTTVSKFIHDYLGSVRLVLNAATGAVRQRRTYDEFGRIVSETSATLQPFGFAGGLYDTDTKLLRFGARDYDPETGRWTSKDPILFAGGDTNLYGYVVADPINLIDPSGKSWAQVGRVIIGVAARYCTSRAGFPVCASPFADQYPPPKEPSQALPNPIVPPIFWPPITRPVCDPETSVAPHFTPGPPRSSLY